MRFVLDSSAALKWVLPEPDSAKALRLRSEFHAGIHELIAPEVLQVECAHALTRAERRRIIPVGDADIHLLNILASGVPLQADQPHLRRAVAISSFTRAGVYDCIYVALAEYAKCELVTADTGCRTISEDSSRSSLNSHRCHEE